MPLVDSEKRREYGRAYRAANGPAIQQQKKKLVAEVLDVVSKLGLGVQP